MNLFVNFKALHPVIKKFDKLKDDERETFYMANSKSIERFYELDDYLHKHEFKPKGFAAEFKACGVI